MAGKEKKIISGTTEIVIFEQKTDTITFITSPEGLTAIEITANPGEREWYWVFTDHLGSITTLLRESDGQKFEMSFDACIVKLVFCECSETKNLVEQISAEERGREGNRRDPATWINYTTTLPDVVIDRGFTGHEHLDVFGLINMNGRVYDPVVARFLSPDPYIQAPDMPQNYNGYVYCLNNPLKYTDPTGYELGVENRNNWFWWVYRGGSYSSHAIGPGSGNHWSDAQRSVYGNFMLMSSSTFQSSYGITSSDYNAIVANFSDFSQMRLITRPNGMQGFYAVNSSASRLSYDAYYNKASNELFVTEVWEVVSPWVNVGMYGQGRGDEFGWVETVFEHTDKTSYVAGLVNGGRKLLETEYIRQANFNITLAGAKNAKVVSSMKAISKTGKVIGVVGTVATYGVAGYQVATGTDNTSTWVDVGVTTGVVVVGIISAPVAITAGVIYGGVRLFWGNQIDGWVDNNWGYR